MRLLHTSDWHLGQHFMGKSRQALHLVRQDWLLAQAEEQTVDAVLIARDMFDTGTPTTSWCYACITPGWRWQAWLMAGNLQAGDDRNDSPGVSG